MHRYTVPMEGGWRVLPEEQAAALARLARCEDMLQNLEEERERLSRQLEELRLQGKSKTARFRELMGRKLVNSQLKVLLEEAGLWER